MPPTDRYLAPRPATRLILPGLMLMVLLRITLAAAPSTEPAEGLRENTPTVHALVGARIVVAPGQIIEQGTIVLRDGLIEAVGADVEPPDDARLWPCEGKTIYAGFIDVYSELTDKTGGDEVKIGGAGYWNPNVTPQVRVDRVYRGDASLNRKMRSQGITTRVVVPTGGIVRGTSAVVTTGDEQNRHAIVKDRHALHLQLTTRRGSNRDTYPNSPMGAVALVRQAFYDARWYEQASSAFRTQEQLPRPETNDALEVMRPYLAGEGPVVVDASNERYFLRADRLGTEFDLNVVVRGSGREYRRLEAIRASGRTVVVPIDFPKAPNVKTPEGAESASLEDLMHWDLAPENPARLDRAGVRIALTAHGLEDTATFWKQVRRAVERGLDRDAALRALTTTPAEMLDLSNRLGTIEVNKAANLVVADGDLFDDKTEVVETWIDGQRYETKSTPLFDVSGTWSVNVETPEGESQSVRWELAGKPTKLSGKLQRGENEVKLDRVDLSDARLAAAFDGAKLEWQGIVRFDGVVTKNDDGTLAWVGGVTWADGSRTAATASRESAEVPAEESKKDDEADDADEAEAGDEAADEDAENAKSDEEAPTDEEADEKEQPAEALFDVNYPLGDYGRDEEAPSRHGAVAFVNAVAWTNGEAGKIERAMVLVEGGKIRAVGRQVGIPAQATVVDLQGQHLTPGIIDCHSHIATDGGVNESGQAITAEVRIGDFINPDDIAIYRQLAGGVTASNILHGSANPIGGQNQVIKMRWGALPEDLKFADAPPGIKFALGENVKQSNWGERYTSRYPQTRMGVEQIVRDAFEAAQNYRREWDAWRRTGEGMPPRVDLELEALAEVVDGSRLVHCHSYRQDEILALLRTCEAYDVQIATLQHILEGYKIADILARHGAGGSSFSDWWAYKLEVYDAIPYNGALLHNAGVVVSFNSDDAELGRRLNLEAAKAMKYGGVSEEDALKFVTLNPAIQLRIADRVGSIEVGKDADLVVWSESPLSAFTRCEQTWIDGRKYFDRDGDLVDRTRNDRKRAELIQRILTTDAEVESLEQRDRREGELWPNEDIFCGHRDTARAWLRGQR